MDITHHHTWAWDERADLIEGARDGAVVGLARAEAALARPDGPRRRPEAIVSAEFYGKTTRTTWYELRATGEPVSPFEARTEYMADQVDPVDRVYGPTPWLRVALRLADGRTVERDLCVDPDVVGAETPDEAREYVALMVETAAAAEPWPNAWDPEPTVRGGWGGCAELGGALGFEEAMERVRESVGPEPAPTVAELEARARMIYGNMAEAHLRAGAPSAREIADQVHRLARDCGREPFTHGGMVELVKRVVPADQIRRLERIVEDAYDVEVLAHARRRAAELQAAE